MCRNKVLSVLLALLALSSMSWATDTVSFTGIWKNQRGSVLKLIPDGANEFKGTFTTAVGKTKTCINHPVPLRAAVNGNAIALSLTMEPCGSPVVIAMTGALRKEDGKEQLVMQGTTQYSGEDHWGSRIQTADFYQRFTEE